MNLIEINDLELKKSSVAIENGKPEPHMSAQDALKIIGGCGGGVEPIAPRKRPGLCERFGPLPGICPPPPPKGWEPLPGPPAFDET
jgi:hypothetical protein